MQIATYCKVSGTRYGCIMSDNELIAVRVFCGEDDDVNPLDNDSMEVSKPIPWDASGRSKLSCEPGHLVARRDGDDCI